MKKRLKIFFTTFFFLVFFIFLLFVLGVIYYMSVFKDSVYPNTFFYDKNIQGLNYSQVEDLVLQKKSDLLGEVNLNYSEKSSNVSISDLGFNWSELKTMDIIFSNKNNSYIKNTFFLVSSLLNKRKTFFQYEYDTKKSSQYLKEISTIIDKEPVDGKFIIKNNKVSEFIIGKTGQKLLIDESIREIENSIRSGKKSIDLKIEEIVPKGVDDMEKMGIKELIATGESNFAGSPPNRIHNINIGSSVFNGILIAPDENFSFINYLGEVNGKTGYLPELVIKEDKTIPEYGGGLCQVSTTFFRAAINAGFPIIERIAHAYRVSYYEPAGFDSTIYQPKPDLVFKNDTGKYVLVQTRISGSKIYVDFYGTSDKRKVEVSSSTIYNYIQPGEPIMIETDELPPGEKKQTDTAHVGADAYFDRIIIYADGTKKEERFSSHYVAWRAKFLVGKQPKEEISEDEKNNSVPEEISDLNNILDSPTENSD